MKTPHVAKSTTRQFWRCFAWRQSRMVNKRPYACIGHNHFSQHNTRGHIHFHVTNSAAATASYSYSCVQSE